MDVFAATRMSVAAFRHTDTLTGTATASLIAAPAAGSGLQIAVYTIHLANSGASSDVMVTIQSATNAIDYAYVAAKSNVTLAYPVESPLFCNSEEALQWTTGSSSTTMHIAVQGVIVPSIELTIV